VAQGLEKIDNVICAIWVEAFKDVLEVGINFIPGGEVLTVAGRAVEGAKTFAENGLEAADFFDNWVGSACGLPDWNFDLWTALLGGPDSLGTSVGCLRKNKSKCKRQDPVQLYSWDHDSSTTCVHDCTMGSYWHTSHTRRRP